MIPPLAAFPAHHEAARGEPFGASLIAAEVNRRFAERLRRPVDTRAASDVLRRMNNAGQLRLVRPGKAFSEALYARGRKMEGE